MLHRLIILCIALLFLAPGCRKKTSDASGSEEATAVEQEDTPEEDAEDDDADAEDGDDETVERETQRWFIFEEKVACGSSDDESCLRIRRAGHPQWETVTHDIQGFEYEEGTRYILEVDVLTRAEDPTEDDAEDADKDEDADAKADEDAAADAADKADEDSDADRSASALEVGYELHKQISPPLEEDQEHTCTSNDDCEDDEMCTGPAGCDIPWTCEAQRPCTRDLRQYCSCDGETIEGSGSCPPAPYKHPGPCKD